MDSNDFLFSGGTSALGFPGGASAQFYTGGASARSFPGRASSQFFSGGTSARGFSGGASAQFLSGMASARGYSGGVSRAEEASEEGKEETDEASEARVKTSEPELPNKMLLQVKRIDKARSRPHGEWRISDTQDLKLFGEGPTESKYSGYSQYVFLVRRKIEKQWFSEFPLITTKILVQSESLVKALAVVMNGTQRLPWNVRPFKVKSSHCITPTSTNYAQRLIHSFLSLSFLALRATWRR